MMYDLMYVGVRLWKTRQPLRPCVRDIWTTLFLRYGSSSKAAFKPSHNEAQCNK